MQTPQFIFCIINGISSRGCVFFIKRTATEYLTLIIYLFLLLLLGIIQLYNNTILHKNYMQRLVLIINTNILNKFYNIV